MIRTKDDVEFHSRYPRNPAVNVKIYKYIGNVKLPIQLGGIVTDNGTEWEYTDPKFTHEWVEENLSEEEIAEAWDFQREQGMGIS